MKIKANIFKTKIIDGPRVYHAYLLVSTKKWRVITSMSTPDTLYGDERYLLPTLTISSTPSMSPGPNFSVRLKWFKWEMVLFRISTESLMVSTYKKYKVSTADTQDDEFEEGQEFEFTP